MEVRQVTDRDRVEVERFLVQHRDSSMFFRSNIRLSGFEYRGHRFEATYMAAFESGRIVGMVGHCWNGLLIVQAPAQAETLARAVLQTSGRELTGFSGPLAHVELVRAALRCPTPTQLVAAEGLYTLDLDALRAPPDDPRLTCRPACPEDRETLLRFRIAYEIETLGVDAEAAARNRDAAQLDVSQLWVAVSADQIVSQSGFNATLPDIVQLGGIYTPPDHRGQRYARAAIAAQLLDARTRGVTRAVLFTKNPSAVRSYTALGFERAGDYALVLLQASAPSPST